MLPKEKYDKPLLSSHEIGWHAPLELFGVCQFGKSRISELQPTRGKSLFMDIVLFFVFVCSVLCLLLPMMTTMWVHVCR